MSTSSRPTDIDAVRAALDAEYEVFEELGRGGMAIVYRARERGLDREVAIKILPPQFAFDESFVERFQREARIAAQLEHPNVVPIHRVGRAGHVVYLAMKLLRGQSLSARLRTQGRLETAEVCRVLVETASALGYAAKRGVVHRDIKPDNIMLDEDDRCIVTDFGIARSATESKLTATGMSVGTPRYMSPEQARATAIDGRSDIYSLGVVGYECLVGTTPLHGDDAFAILMAHINDPVPRPALRTDEERALFQVIERMLAKDPRHRFQSADEIVAALRSPTAIDNLTAARTGLGIAATVVSPAATAPKSDAFPSGPDESGPRPSAALDRALDLGLDLLKQQKPKLEAGLATSRDLLAAQRPHLEAARTAVAGRGARSVAWLTGRSRTFWKSSMAACIAIVPLYYGTHFATKHRSNCPLPAVAAAATVASGAELAKASPGVGSSAAPAATFAVLVDGVAARKPGQSVQLYYDVCGLERGTSYTANVRIARNESGIKRLLGGSVEPITLAFESRASGPAERHHETIDLSGMPPGSYSLALSVTDASGRRRDKASTFQVLNP